METRSQRCRVKGGLHHLGKGSGAAVRGPVIPYFGIRKKTRSDATRTAVLLGPVHSRPSAPVKWVESGFLLSLPHLHGDLPRVASLLPGLAQMSSFPRTVRHSGGRLPDP